MIKEYQDILVKPEGFISAYGHKGDLEFVQVGAEKNQGYYRLPKACIEQEMHLKNLIVTKASQFMAKRMRPGANWGSGIQYLEVGTGVGTGTTQSPQAETTAQTVLRESLARKAISSWTYLDANGVATASETNVIQLTTTFTSLEAVGAIVEMGLFGGDASATVATGYMFNYKTFPVWNKQDDMSLTIVWKLTF
jgi:ribose 5-phosphate isomerase